MPHDLILFDLDGTLSDPALGIGRSIDYALERHGFAPLAEGEVSRYIGPPLDEGFRVMTGRDDDATIHSLIAAHRNGLSAAGVLWGHGSRDELQAEGPRYLVDRPAELTRWLPDPASGS